MFDDSPPLPQGDRGRARGELSRAAGAGSLERFPDQKRSPVSRARAERERARALHVSARAEIARGERLVRHAQAVFALWSAKRGVRPDPARRAPQPLRSRETRLLLQEHARTRDLEIRNELVRRYEPLVRRQVERFGPVGPHTREDLLQVGLIGLIEALQRFDPENGAQFASFAVPTIAGVLKHYLRDQGWMLKAPRRVRELALKLPRLRAEAEHRLCRPPTVGDLARAAEVTEEQLLEAMDLNVAREPTSLDLPRVDGDGGSGSLGDAVGAPDPGIAAIHDRDAIRRALGHLEERQRAVIYYRFYRSFSQSETARRVGISQMHVSRLERLALQRLKCLLGDTYGEEQGQKATGALASLH